MSKLYECPYNKATKCDLLDGCLGCETFSEHLTSEPKKQSINNDALLGVSLPCKAVHKTFGKITITGARIECDSNNNTMYMFKTGKDYFWVYDYETELLKGNDS